MKKGTIKASVLLSACNLLFSVIAISFVSPFNVFADISDSNSENQVVEDAILSSCSFQDIKATEAYLINKTNDGDSRATDVDGNGNINILDMIQLKSQYNQEGDFISLYGEMFSNSEISTITDKTNSVISSTDSVLNIVKNVLIVVGNNSIDFKEYNYHKLLKGPNNTYFIEFNDGFETENALKALKNNPNVIAVDYDYVYNMKDELIEEQSSTIQNDNLNFLFPDMEEYNSWGVYDLKLDEYAKYISQNANSNITIAVLDSGFEKEHPFLKHKLLDGYDSADKDYDVSPLTYSGKDQDIIDTVSHGTHVAGIIVDCCKYTDVKVLPVKVVDSNYSFTDSAIISGLYYAQNQGCKVINCSFGTQIGTKPARDAIMRQIIESGINIVVSAGNDKDRGLIKPWRYSPDTANKSPANIKECIVVGASNIDDEVTNFSCYGESVDVVAPGVKIYSSFPRKYGDYVYLDGTSMSAPHISAAVALIQAQFPEYSPKQIEKTLISTCMDIGAEGKDKYSGYGIPKLNKLIGSKNKSVNPDDSVTPTNPSIKLSSSILTLYKGDQTTIYANTNLANTDIRWESSNSSIVSVSNGILIAKEPGTIKITASITYNNNKYSDTCTVTVSEPNIRLNETSKSVYQTNVFTLSAVTTPNNMTIYWSSSNNNVATVSDGKVKAINPGTTNITASISYNNQSYSASCKVTVNEVSVKLSETSKTIYQTDVFTINAYTTPSNIPVTWKTSNSNILTVKDGKVTGINPGSAVITASIVYNGQEFSDSCSVTVKKVSIEISPDTNSVFITDSLKLTAKTSPEGLGVSWNSENNMIASVNNGSVTTKAKGNVLITAKMVYNGTEYSATSRISVLEPSVKLNESQVKINANDTYKLIATTLPENAKVTWETDDSSVCKVTNTGIITGLKTGNVTVRAKILYGQKTYYDECNVFVGEPGITLNQTSFSMFVQDSQTLVATIKAIDGTIIFSNDNLTETESDIVWKSSDAKIATVSNNGTVSGISAGGPVTITASYDFNGKSYSATCQVTVINRPTIAFKNLPDNIYIGDKIKIPFTVTPSNQNVSWTSSDSAVISVDSRGVITAISNGSATIKASFKYNGVNYYTTGTINVITPSINLSNSSKAIIQGDQFKLTASTKPNNQTVSWSSSNSSIVSVDSNGNITGKEAGSTSIIAQFTYMGNIYSARCNVTVNPLTLTLSSYNGSVIQNVWNDNVYDNTDLGIVNRFAHKTPLPEVNCSISDATYTWEIINGEGWIGGIENLYITKPGTVTARCTVSNNGIVAYKDYKFELQWYKTTTDVNYFYKTSDNAYLSPYNRYNFNIPNNTTVYISEIAVNGRVGESGTTIYGKTNYNGCEGWIIISAW